MKKSLQILVVCILLLAGGLVWLRRFGGHLEQKAAAPSGSIIAEVRLNTLAAATDANVVSVRLYPSVMRFGDNVFDASTYGGDVSVMWQDQSHLRIRVKHPDQLEIHRQLKNWKGVTIIYENE
jgi:hypothetical protein